MCNKCNQKTLWQQIYSFFGFWSFQLSERNEDGIKTYRVWYWCCLPWGKYYRKYNLIKYQIG
jgi:hypothetical protein